MISVADPRDYADLLGAVEAFFSVLAEEPVESDFGVEELESPDFESPDFELSDFEPLDADSLFLDRPFLLLLRLSFL